MTKLRAWTEASLLSFALAFARVAPRGALTALGAAIGELGYLLDARHRRISRENLILAYGDELDPRSRTRLARACWRHFGRTVLETLRFPKLSKESIGTQIHYEGLEHIRGAYEKGRGVLLFSGHFGNWELIALMQGYLGLPLSLVVRRLDNPILERRLNRLRGQSGNDTIRHLGGVREMLKTLRSGRGVAIMIDQDARRHGIFVPFFGRMASTTPTLALLALKTGATIVPVFCVPQPDGSYRVTYEAPIEEETTGDRDSDVIRITAACTASIERWVRKHPEMWLWMHRRWKTAPPLDLGGEHGATSHLSGS
jgi:KDO2-lipid IV(A) lauroyltransferase